ncbi:Fic family protein [Thermoflavimicrobium dichotomicum]|uniref:Fic/DOC family protein n=1 Tax=Thermoflavimicrobium dichotomicum TaxID=46223 RepID=A0A1I3UTZ0_9BACL|nr:Fic family protein [Thermoflavimicrobium dichotomicum]SFJ85317.1 Fic/DOC family protein [Thermoflavimicrobium dichotomicum]
MRKIDQLNELRKQYPIHPITMQSFKETLDIEWTYHSNSIEGSTLTLAETAIIIADGITIGGKSVREHLEAINHKEAILFLEELAKDHVPMSEQVVKEIHSIILRGIDTKNAGVYRHVPIYIRGQQHVPSQPWKVPIEMEQIMYDYYEKWQDLHPIERAAFLHCEFVRIHPFIDGNGRTARLIMNLELMKSGLVPLIIRKDQRKEYFEALQHYDDQKDISQFLTMIEALEEEMLERYIEAGKACIPPDDIEEESDGGR